MKTLLRNLLFAYTGFTLLFFVFKEARATISGPAVPAREVTVAYPRFLAYYFHGTARCVTCKKIESLTEETLRSVFPERFQNGSLVWKPVNLEDDGNAHFLGDFKLTVRCPVLVEESGPGKVARFFALAQVWDLVGAPDIFKQYVKQESRRFILGRIHR